MSTVEGDDNEASSVDTSNPPTNNDDCNTGSTRPATASGTDSENASKVIFLLRAAGGAPILKRRRWTLPRTKTMGHIVEFLKKYMQVDGQQQLFLYVNQAFAPALDTTIGSVNDCFSSDGTLVLHYALTPAWG